MNKTTNYITTIPYQEVDFYYIQSHWDLHLAGLCKYRGELMKFKTIEGEYDPSTDDFLPSYCKIYKLTLKEKIKYLTSKWYFESTVGYIWTYPYRKDKKCNYGRDKVRKYKWLYTCLYKVCWSLL